MNQLSFIKLQMVGSSTLLKYESSIKELSKDIEISKLTFSGVVYE